jgi:hypothetical protein
MAQSAADMVQGMLRLMHEHLLGTGTWGSLNWDHDWCPRCLP